MSQKMRVSNHREYNKFLEKRGNIFYDINEAIENWYEIGPKCRWQQYLQQQSGNFDTYNNPSVQNRFETNSRVYKMIFAT